MRFIRTVTVVLGVCFSPMISHAFSSIDNRGLLPIGEVEAFMANTGVALTGSTGAVYYNPAGLASLKDTHLSISANSYLSTKSEINPLQTIDGTDLDFHVGGLQTIPTSFVSTGHIGDYHYAFSILVPHQLKIQDSTGYSSPHYPTMQYSRTNAFQTLQVGPSLAGRFGLYDIGVGCFYTMYTTTQSSSFTANTNLSTNALVISSYFDSSVNGLMCNAGVQAQLTVPLRMGITLRSPFVKLSSSGTATSFIQSPTSGQSLLTGPKGVETDNKIPFDASVGFEYKFSPELLGYLDASYQFSQTQNSGDLAATDDVNKGTARVSAGASYLVSQAVTAYAGLAYNPSSVETTVDDYGQDFVDGTIGARLTYEHSTIGVGVMYAQGQGSKPAPAYDYQLNQTGQKTADVSTRAFGFLLSSGFVF